MSLLNEYGKIDEEHGILKCEQIVERVTQVLDNYDVNFCYLFGYYAKNKATETSDVDLLIDTSTKGLDYYQIVEELRQRLCKRVDVLDFMQLKDNLDLTKEILTDGVKIYKQNRQ